MADRPQKASRLLEGAERFIYLGAGGILVVAAVALLVITAESTTNVDLSDPYFQAVLAELALLGGMILLLAVSLRILDGVDTRD